MAALGGVYLIALLIYTLIERQVRKALAARGEPRPDRPAPSQRPTARPVFQLLCNMAVVTLVWAGRHGQQVTALNRYQLHVINLLGDDRSLYGVPHRNPG